MRLLAGLLAVSAVIVLGIAAFEAIPAPSNGPAHGIVWAGKTFATRAEFARWLRSEGVTYRAWARSHPVHAGPARGQDHSGWSPRALAGIAAFLGALALGLALVRRRWPESGAATAAAIGAGARRTGRWAAPRARRSFAVATAAMGAGARRTGRWAAPRARRSIAVAGATASRVGRATGSSIRHLIEVMGPRGAVAIQAGARTSRRWSARTARRSMDLASAAAPGTRNGIGRSAARRRDLAAPRRSRRAEPAKAGARTTRRRTGPTARRLSTLGTEAVFGVRRRRPELAWYVTTALLAAGVGLAVTVFLSRGP